MTRSIIAGVVGVTLSLSLIGCHKAADVAPAPVAVNAPSAAPQTARAPVTVSKTVPAGTKSTVFAAFALNPDCTLLAYPTVELTKPPAHGTAEIAHGEDYPTYPPANPRSSCNLTRVPQTIVSYTPAPGFVGQDSLSIRQTGQDGTAHPANLSLTIQ